MSLKQNGRLSQQLPLRFRGGSVLSFEYQETNKSQLRNMFAGDGGIDPRNGAPSGHLSPSVWILPQKEGGISSFTGISGLGDFDGSGSLGKNIVGSISGAGDISSSLLLVVSAIANVIGVGSVSGNVSSSLSLAITMAGSGSVSGVADALASVFCSLYGAGGLLGSQYSTGGMSANITAATPLSPQSLADAVWNAIKTDYNNNNSMGVLVKDIELEVQKRLKTSMWLANK